MGIEIPRDTIAADLVEAHPTEHVRASHVLTEPVARHLSKSHPDVAARVFRALGIRILNARKSRYYDFAVEHFASARRCCLRAGIPADGQNVIDEVRRDPTASLSSPGRVEALAFRPEFGGGSSAKSVLSLSDLQNALRPF